MNILDDMRVSKLSAKVTQVYDTFYVKCLLLKKFSVDVKGDFMACGFVQILCPCTAC